ncbi:MAG: ABC-F family ATP-binding cassette domain-containing protein [Acetobacteraceae bacterium]
MPPLLALQDIALTHGATPLLTAAALAVGPGERVCLVGRNGSGKSTLLRIAAGLMAADSGTRFVQPGATIRYLPQEPDLSGHASIVAYVLAGLGPDPAAAERHAASAALAAFGLTGAEDPARLSGGEARRAALARALAADPDILLLDEPTNHLDLPGIERLEAALAAARAGLVLVSHDRRLLEHLSRATIWLDRGITRRLEQGFAAFESWRDETLAQEAIAQHKRARKIAAEEDWLRYGVTARRKRNQKRLAELHALRARHRAYRAAAGTATLAATTAEMSGRLVIAADQVAFGWPGRPLLRGVTLRILRGDRVGIVGPNGAGKTTLLNLLTGALAPQAGEVRLGAGLATVSLDQRRATLDPVQTLRQALAMGGETVTIGGRPQHVMGALKAFLFTPEQANTPVGMLSGGERGRLLLARAFAVPSNLLVLDEPTNDLDLETLELLQELLADYPGTVLLVSHDRDFLDRVATMVIAAEGNGTWTAYAGGYSDMLAQRGGRAPVGVAPPRQAAAARPTPARPAPALSRRMTYRDRHALEVLPGRIAGHQAEIERLSALLADGGFYARDPAGFAAAAAALEAARAALAADEDRWLELELAREAVEGGG